MYAELNLWIDINGYNATYLLRHKAPRYVNILLMLCIEAKDQPTVLNVVYSGLSVQQMNLRLKMLSEMLPILPKSPHR